MLKNFQKKKKKKDWIQAINNAALAQTSLLGLITIDSS